MSLSSEERMEILHLLAEGKITADEAARLLSNGAKATEAEPAPEKGVSLAVEEKTSADEALKSSADQPTWFHVKVNDMKTGKTKVTVNIPLRLLRLGLNVGSRFAPELEGMDWDDLAGMIGSEQGVLVDVEDEEDGEHVQIYVD